MIFNIDHIGDNLGKYEPFDDTIEIFLGTIWHHCKQDNILSEDLLIKKIIDVVVHELYHYVIDPCLEDPEKVDDHKVYKYLYND